MSKQIKIEYDDNIFYIIEEVNKALGEYGFEFVSDEEEHDGFEIFTLVNTFEK